MASSQPAETASTNRPEPGDVADAVARYAQDLQRAPLAVRTREAYGSHVAGYGRWLTGRPGAAAAIAEPRARDHAAREFKRFLKLVRLVLPDREHVASYVAALERGWSPLSTRPEFSAEQLERIRTDVDGFLAACEDRDARQPPPTFRDGTTVPRLPSVTRWLWDGEFCGLIDLRWQPGTAALPSSCLGHVGYSVVPWRGFDHISAESNS